MKFFALSALSGLLWALTFPKFDLEWLAWFAFIPLFWATFGQTPQRSAGLGFVMGMVFYLVSLSWINNTLINFGNIPTVLAWGILILLAAYLSFYIALFCYLLNRFGYSNPVYGYLLSPLLWTALEYLRSTDLELGFSWQGLGYSQFQTLPVIQLAEFTGVYGISFLIVLVNAGLFFLMHPRIALENPWRKFRLRVFGLTATTLALCLGFGFYTLNTPPPQKNETLKVALIQGNIPQHIKWNPAYRQQVMEKYKELTLQSAGEKPDLVVWPEAVTPFMFERDQQGANALRALARDTGIPLVFGSPASGMKGDRPVLYNSAYYISEKGQVAPQRYDKVHLVPFGEFVPFRNLLFFVEKMVEVIGDFDRGTGVTLFSQNGNAFGVSICFEIAFPDLVRQPVREGATFLVNITNDAWFGKSAASYQHISMAALRAVENRVPIVRAANTGITGTIDPLGRIGPATEIFVEEALVTSIRPSANGPTLYALFGDWFPRVCIALCILLPLMARRAPQSHRSHNFQ